MEQRESDFNKGEKRPPAPHSATDATKRKIGAAAIKGATKK